MRVSMLRSVVSPVAVLLLTACGATTSSTDGGQQTGGKRIFITKTTFLGNLGGLAGADAKCTAAAAARSLGGTWKAWLSDASTNAIDRIGDVGPWVLVGSGTRVFDNKAQLETGQNGPVNRNESGALIDVPALTVTQDGCNTYNQTCNS